MNEQHSESPFNEWLLPRFTSFLPVLLIYPTLWLTFLPIDETVGVISGIAVTVLVLAMMIGNAPRISVADGWLRLGKARIETKYISTVELIAEEDKFAVRGRFLDSRAHIFFQGSVKPLIKVNLNDPQDPTPYWLFSTRKPEQLAKALGF
jgi:Protein of unknown function (DUF3093)